MNCYFYIENFKCETTDADKCFDALKTRIRSSATPDEERKLFATCAEWIYKKDTYKGAEAQALLHQQREKEKKELSNEITLFSRDIPSFDHENWKSFIQKKKDLINTFRLCRYLKERWNRLGPKEKYQYMTQVDQIIDLLKNTYPGKKKEIHRALKSVISESNAMKLHTREEEIIKEIKILKKDKKWEKLYQYTSELNLAGYSHDFMMRVTAEQGHAEEGRLWQQKKQKLEDLAKNSHSQPLDDLEQDFLDIREELSDMLENQTKFGPADAGTGIQQAKDQLELNILNKIKNSQQSPREKLQQLKLWENHLQVLKHQPSNQWNEYDEELNFEIAKGCTDEILTTLNTLEDIHEIKLSVDKHVKQTDEMELKEKIREYIAEKKIVDIFEIQENIRELEKFDRSLEQTITTADPFRVKFAVSKQPGDFQGIPQSVISKLTQKYQAIEEIIRFTATTTDQLELLAVSLQKESKNIVLNNPMIKLELFERQFEAIREKTTQILGKYQDYQFKFLENLEKITGYVNELLFPPRSAQETPRAGQLSKNQFIKSINENIAGGVAFNNKLQELKSKIDDRVIEDPIDIQDKFFEIITVYKDKAFIFPKPAVKKVCKLYIRLKEIIHAKIDNYLKPLKKQLNFPFPLLETGKLRELEEKTGRLLEQMDKIDLTYPGYEEFVEIYKDELEQWKRVIEIHGAVHEKRYEEAAGTIENGIYEPDISYPARILVYYYRYLFQSEGNENQWLNFFARFSPESLKANESGYQVILKEYKKEVRKNFHKLALAAIETHYKIFKTLYANDNLLPYLSYLARQDTARDFFKNIQVERRPVIADVFKAMVTMLKNSKDWKLYMALYNHSPKKCRRYFEKPVDNVTADLDQHYKVLVEKFTAQTLEIADIDAFVDKIPEGQDFLAYFAKSKKMKELSDSYQEITRTFKSLEDQDIWMQDDFYNRVFHSLGRHTDRFTEEFNEIRKDRNWSKRIASLRHIYDLGLKLKKQLEEIKEMDVNYRIRAEEDYSKKLRKSTQELLNTWNKFNSEIDGLKENTIYKKTFQHYYLKGFIEKWQAMSLYQLWLDEGNDQPGSLDDYFKMWETILETHNQFLTYYNNMKEKNKALQIGELERTKVLDEFTRLTIERLKQQGKS